MKITLQLLILFTVPFIVNSQVQVGSNISDTSGFQAGFGNSISLSSNGNILAVGANRSDINGTNSGTVRVYENLNGVWTQIGSNIVGEAARNELGHSVSLSDDGSILAIGAVGDENGSDPGTLRVFENINGDWIQIGGNIDGDSNGDEFGYSVSISSDGNMVAVGAPKDFLSIGYVRIFENNSGVWTQIGNDIAGSGALNEFGHNVKLSSDGSIVAVGAPLNDDGGEDAGQVRVFENQNGTWTQIGNNIDGEAAGDESGHSVSLSSNGNIVAIGAPLNDGNGDNSGQVRVFENQSGTWTQIGNDINGEAATNQSGASISLSSDGNILAIGAPVQSEDFGGDGQLRVYENQGATWTQLGMDINGSGIGDNLGRSVSISDDGSIVAAGAPTLVFGYIEIYDYSATLISKSFDTKSFDIVVNKLRGRVDIKLHDQEQLMQINLFDIYGNHLNSTKQLSFNTAGLSSGIYIVQIETERGKSAKKVIID